MPTPDVPSGFVSDGAVGSAFSVTKLDKPLPAGFVISSTFTRILAVGKEDSAYTPRAIPECAATETSSVEDTTGATGTGFGIGTNVAVPPSDWFAIVSRKVLSVLVAFCTVITN